MCQRSAGALVSLDHDGAMLAMVGGTDYVTSNYNRAVNSVRQPGSAWKLFVDLAALEAGLHARCQSGRRAGDRSTAGARAIRAGRFAGPIDVRSAFAYSKNTVAAQLGNEVGFGAVAQHGAALRVSPRRSTRCPRWCSGSSGRARDRHGPRVRLPVAAKGSGGRRLMASARCT